MSDTAAFKQQLNLARFRGKDMNIRAFIKITILLLIGLAVGIVKAETETEVEMAVHSVCPSDALEADVVAIDHPMIFNRLGAQNVNWMMYALRHDIVDISNPDAYKTLDYTAEGEALFEAVKRRHTSRNIALRPDLRPRPLVLRVAAGEHLKVRFTNLLHHKLNHYGDAPPNYANPFNSFDPLLNIDHPTERGPKDIEGELDAEGNPKIIFRLDDQVASRTVGFHPQGLELVRSINDDSSYVGQNPNSLARPGETREYCFYAPVEGAFLVSNDGAVFGGEGTAGNSGVGLFGAVTVQPKGARFYRAQVTEEEMRLATTGITRSGQPIINYEAIYECKETESDCIWNKEGKAGKPVLNMVQGNRIIHGDINALIIGPNDDGAFPSDTYPLESIGKRNPTLPNRLEPFREFVSIFHDENAATQAFPYFFEHPELKHTLHGVRDSFMINYGSGGIGSEIIANRLQAGPMQDCLDCAYEEFFLSAFAVGDSAMLVDKPANLVTSQCQPEFVAKVKIPNPLNPDEEIEVLDPRYQAERENFCVQPSDQKATEAYYPYDPSNVHHSYIGDFVKFRNMHSGKEQHIFHLHNHQWLFNPNDDNSNYIDAQGLGPGSGYTYEIAFGGSGNRNKTVGDAIFHCHFYPHFAQGMWYMWRNHDVFEAGTPLAVSQTDTGFHDQPFALQHGKPAANSRALPDGEIVAGTPIPAIVPLPGKGMAPMPEPVHVTHKENGLGSKAELVNPFNDQTKNPGYPFWVAGVTEHSDGGITYSSSVGSRPTTPPLDMSEIPGIVKGHDGGLTRHAMAGFSTGGKAKSLISRFTAEKHLEKASPIYFPEEGTSLERLAMEYHAKPRGERQTYAVNMDGSMSSAYFETNGAEPVPGAPFNEPCIDDKGMLLAWGGNAEFFGATYDEDGYFDVFSVLPGGIEFGAGNPRVYKGANLQLDVVFNKIGYHYPQQRILTLWEDVGPLLKYEKPPEPLVMRMNTFDCAMYAHTNLVPHYFYGDDYQITTPTDVIGQHIHLPKWDLTSADGGANGWNYEDGTFSPGMVRERIAAINALNENEALMPVAHPYFKGYEEGNTDSICANDEDCEYQFSVENCQSDWHQAIDLAEINKRNNELEVQALIEHRQNMPENCGWLDDRYHLSESACDALWEEMIEEVHTRNTSVSRLFEINSGMPGACDWFGARTTLQRWFSDPIVNTGGIHRGLGTTFTHDHLGPSTHQQIGLYATMLTEPPGSEWWHNELDSVTGQKVKLYDMDNRQDGGPTSWQAVISGKDGESIDYDGTPGDDSHREFFLQFGDFQHAYVKGAYYGVSKDGVGWMNEDPDNPPEKSAKPTHDSFRLAINPSVRKPAQPVFPDIIAFEPTCPGGRETIDGGDLLSGSVYGENDFTNPELYNSKGQPLRPCAEGISADDVGMMVVNYRNEPLGARVYDPHAFGPDGKRGTQTKGLAGDMAFAMQTRIDRAIDALNTAQGAAKSAPFKYYPLTQGIFDGDPFTPILQAFAGDHVKVKIQGGSHEHEHNGSINGVKWLQSGSGFGHAPHSGWRNAQNAGLSEQFTFTTNLIDYESPLGINDRMYAVDTSQDGLWNGVWGVLRSYNRAPLHHRLMPLASNTIPTLLAPSHVHDHKYEHKHDSHSRIDNVCPADAPVQYYHISAVLANKVLKNELGITIPRWKSESRKWWEWWSPRTNLNPSGGTLVYNPQPNEIGIRIVNEEGEVVDTQLFKSGPLHDPTAILFVHNEDLDKYGRLRPDAPVEPLVLRAAAGDCIHITMTNRLPENPAKMPDLYGYTSVSGIIPRNCSELGNAANDDAAHCERSEYYDHASTTFNNNLVRPSNHIGLHPQLVHYDLQASDGNNVGLNSRSTVAPGKSKRYAWYAGTIEVPPLENACLSTDDSAYETLNNFSLFYKEPLSSADLFTAASLDRNIYSFLNRRIFDQNKKMPNGESFDQYRFNPALNEADVDFGMVLKDNFNKWRMLEEGIFDNMFYSLSDFWGILTGKLPQSCLQYFGDDRTNMSKIDTLLFDRGRIVNTLAECLTDAKLVNEFPISPYTTRLVSLQQNNEQCEPARFVAVEYGGSNLTPPDRIKQGQKGAIGALVIEPEGATWEENDTAIDRQNPGSDQSNTRTTRMAADVKYPVIFDGKAVDRQFRDLVLVHQKGLNLRYKDGSAIPNIAAEKEDANEDPQQTAPEDAHDSGHMAINYGTEPMWFRFGLPPDSDFGKAGLGGVDNAWQAFSNGAGKIGTVINGDSESSEPYVPILTTYAGQEMRIRALMPTGVGRATTGELHGHHWPRDPYLAEHTDNGYPRGNSKSSWGVASQCIGNNALAFHLGGQESISPMAHFDLVFPKAGGEYKVVGDYLWRDHAGFGITNGLWALVRVTDAPPEFNDGELGSLRSNCDLPG